MTVGGLRFVATAMVPALWAASGFVCFYKGRYSFAEAAAAGIMSSVMTACLIVQMCRLFPWVFPFPVLVGGVTLLSTGCLVKSRRRAVKGLGQVWSFAAEHPVSTGMLLLMLGYLATVAVGASLPAGGVSDGLVGNPEVLPQFFVMAGADRGYGLFSLASYASIGFATYALSRRYAWPTTAFLAVVVLWSMPRLILISVQPRGEIVYAAAALFCMLCLFRLIERPDFADFSLCLSSVAFGIAYTPMSAAFWGVFLLLAGILLIRRHGMLVRQHFTGNKHRYTLGLVVPVFVFLQVVPLLRYRIRSGAWHPPTTGGIVYNADAIFGAAGNLIRYMLQAVHFPGQVGRLVHWMFGVDPEAILMALHRWTVTPFLGDRGTGAPFCISWQADATTSWFGPLGAMLILPAVLYAAVRGPRRLKAVAVALLGYFYLATLIPAWTPEAVQYFTLFFVCGGCCTAFFLPPWRFGRLGGRVLMATCAAVAVLTCMAGPG